MPFDAAIKRNLLRFQNVELSAADCLISERSFSGLHLLNR
jgi:hypothetical protein